MRFSARRRARPFMTAALPPLLSLALVASGVDAALPSRCVRNQSRQLAGVAACGHPGSVDYCLANLPVEADDQPPTELLARLESCFVNAGCTLDEAQIEAIWTLKRCESPADLRKRDSSTATDAETTSSSSSSTSEASTGASTTTTSSSTSTDASTTTTSSSTSSTSAAATTTTSSSTSSTSAAATTTTSSTSSTSVASAATTSSSDSTSSAASATTTSSSDSSSSAASTTTSTTTTSSSTSTTSATSTTTRNTKSPADCYITKLVDTSVCPVQSTGVSSGVTLSCYSSQRNTSSCADGLICSVNSAGSTSCMYAQTKLDTAGLIVALIFGIGGSSALFLIMFFCCRERREQRQLVKAAEAAAIAREANVAARKAAAVSSVSSIADHSLDGSSRDGHGYGGSRDPFADKNRPRL